MPILPCCFCKPHILLQWEQRSNLGWAIPSRDACLDPNAGMLCLCTAALPCAVPQQLLVPAALCSHQGKHDFMSWGARWSWLCIPHPCADLRGVLHPCSLPWPSGLARGEPGRRATLPSGSGCSSDASTAGCRHSLESHWDVPTSSPSPAERRAGAGSISPHARGIKMCFTRISA